LLILFRCWYRFAIISIDIDAFIFIFSY
jgi:hypothetical protein